jgi:putative restriction endonuclease
MNWVKEHRKGLEIRNYVRKATHTTNYWFDFMSSRMDEYVRLTDGDFNLILFGDESDEGDFYVIPYQAVKDLLVIENKAADNRSRWIGNIINHKLSITRSGIRRDVSDYFSRPVQSELVDAEAENDYAIENAKREIYVRQHQSRFRRLVLENFGNQCCISGVTETDLLVASHIIPWSAKIETRLDPSNGLCLMVLYDKLFDKGYFTLDETLSVEVTPQIDGLSEEITTILNCIAGRTISTTATHSISEESLAYHREHIFISA